MKKQTTVKPPFIHFEVFTQEGEDKCGNDPYVLILPADYQTNEQLKSTLRANIQHMADVMNSQFSGDCSVQQDLANFPYVRYEEFAASPLRKNAWVFVSRRNVWDQLTEVKAFMDDVVSVFPPRKPDTLEPHPLCDYKIKWESPTIKAAP